MAELAQKTKGAVTESKQVESISETSASNKVDTEALKAELDELLDSIDEVLETNAEEFVANFVQKGGE